LGTRKLYYLLREEFSGTPLAGRDKLFALLGENGLLVRKRRRNAPRTTCSWHHYHRYPDLYQGRIPAHVHQVWVSDITYLRLFPEGFVYLSLVTDACSHKIVGWDVSETLGLEGALSALQRAVATLPAQYSLIHHSDRGVQYCSYPYTDYLRSAGISISMTQSGDPRENAVAERVNGILKEEWLNRETFTDRAQAARRVAEVVELYNTKRPHLSLDYRTPQQAHTLPAVPTLMPEAQPNRETGAPSTGLRRRWHTYQKRKEGEEKIAT
jgi:transposase InsO family protein